MAGLLGLIALVTADGLGACVLAVANGGCTQRGELATNRGRAAAGRGPNHRLRREDEPGATRAGRMITSGRGGSTSLPKANGPGQGEARSA